MRIATGRLANQIQRGVDVPIVNKGEGSTSIHMLGGFLNNIQDLKTGTYVWNEEAQKWDCTSCKD